MDGLCSILSFVLFSWFHVLNCIGGWRLFRPVMCLLSFVNNSIVGFALRDGGALVLRLLLYIQSPVSFCSEAQCLPGLFVL